ncbi:MAG: hypothetical protein K2W95_09345 [Candidatus Obscuribacterales bacterium]|nr:hypothetical protein [Candidatus Obscuribacterales bacterium]
MDNSDSQEFEGCADFTEQAIVSASGRLAAEAASILSTEHIDGKRGDTTSNNPDIESGAAVFTPEQIEKVNPLLAEFCRESRIKSALVTRTDKVRRVSIESEPTEIKLGESIGCRKLTVDSKIFANLTNITEGSVSIDKIRGVKAEIPVGLRHEGAQLWTEADITKIEVTNDRDDQPAIQITAKCADGLGTTTIPLPAALKMRIKEVMQQSAQATESSSNINAIETIVMITSGAILASRIGFLVWAVRQPSKATETASIGVKVKALDPADETQKKDATKGAQEDKVTVTSKDKPISPSTPAIAVGSSIKTAEGHGKVKAFDSTKDVYVLEYESDRSRTERLITPTDFSLANEYSPVKIDGKQMLYDKVTGEVFEKTGKGNELKQVRQYEVLTAAALRVELAMNNVSDRVSPLLGAQEVVFKNTRVTGDISGHKVAVSTKGAYFRTMEIDGRPFTFSGDTWFQSPAFTDSKGEPLKTGNVKVHVLSLDAAELAKIQVELIPELYRACAPGGPLHGKVAVFKTHDPMFALEAGWEDKVPWNTNDSKFKPGSKGQQAKGFTIYSPDAAAGKEVQEYVDKFLKAKGLALEGKVNTGNVGDRTVNPAGSNRVTIERDYANVGVRTSNGTATSGALLPREMSEAITEYATKKLREGKPGWETFKDTTSLYQGDPANGQLKEEVLRLIEKDFKIDSVTCRLSYTDALPGQKPNLMLEGQDIKQDRKQRIYLREAGAVNDAKYDPVTGALKEGLTGRPAFYELATGLGTALDKDLDPATLEAERIRKRRTGPEAAPALPEKGAELEIQNKKYKVAAIIGANVILFDPTKMNFSPTATQLTNQELADRYERVEVLLDGKTEPRYMEKGHPEKGLFVLAETGGTTILGADPTMSMVPKAELPSLMKAQKPPQRVPEPSSAPGTVVPLPVNPPAGKPAADRPPITPDRLGGTLVAINPDGTRAVEDIRIGDSMTAERLEKQTAVSEEQIKFMEREIERLRKSDKAEDLKNAARLEETVKTLRGAFGEEARIRANQEILKAAKQQAKQKPGGGLGGAIGCGILLSAVIGWHESGHRPTNSPLVRPGVGGK